MKKRWGIWFYLTLMIVCGMIIYIILLKGKSLQVHGIPAWHSEAPGQHPDNIQSFADSFHQNLRLSLPVLVLQIIVIIIFSRFFGFLFKKIGQPAVVGEIVAGIVLGPSLLGLFFPGISQFLFPVNSIGNLQFLSQLGLILFMFVIGLELDTSLIRKQATGAVVISHASIVIPYTMGMGLSYFFYTRYAPDSIPFLSFALFMGIAMSITAFPVLARILQERKMTGSPLGALALTCAAADDVTAWCILALLVAVVKAGSSISALFTIGLVLVYGLFMIFILKNLLKWIHKKSGGGRLGSTGVALIFIVLLLSAYTTETIGIHALFGSFMAGLVMPQEAGFRKAIIEKIEDISMVLLLPLFFVLTGLRTRVEALQEGGLWIAFCWILLVAVAGKFGGSALTARLVGQSWKDSLSIGALMNTRGLMELIVLNIGYDLGILSPAIFSMMVLMALLTTFLTNPMLNLIERVFR